MEAGAVRKYRRVGQSSRKTKVVVMPFYHKWKEKMLHDWWGEAVSAIRLPVI